MGRGVDLLRPPELGPPCPAAPPAAPERGIDREVHPGALNCCAWRKKVASRALMKDGAAPTPPCMLLEKRAACALAWARPAPCHSALRRARATAGGLIVQYASADDEGGCERSRGEEVKRGQEG